MNWRTTIALQKISSRKKINAKRLPRKKRTEVLLRQGRDFGNRIEVGCLLTLVSSFKARESGRKRVNAPSRGWADGKTRPESLSHSPMCAGKNCAQSVIRPLPNGFWR